MKLFQNARLYSFEPGTRQFVRHRSLLIDGTTIAGLDCDPTGINVERVDLNGATILPAFADCHAHLTDTGYFTGPHDLRGLRDYDAFARAVAAMPERGGIVFGGRYDESIWNDGRSADALALQRAHGDAMAMLVRVDAHSCIVNAATLDSFGLEPDTPGIERDADGRPTGKLFLEANWRAQAAFLAHIPLAFRRAAERRAAALALSRGIVHVHAQLVGFAPEAYADEVAALRELPLKVYPKVCEPDARLAQSLGLPFVGGDVFLDGSLGSRTAALSTAYCDGSNGALRFSDEELFAYFSGAESLGIAAGVHAIGDAAIEQCVRVWDRVLDGEPSPRGSRHFIEHFELASPEHIAACARLGIGVSLQPLFDAYWGGDGGMYEQALGAERKRGMNPLRAIDAAGVALCGGSDAPVCAFDALAGMQACVDHHEPDQALSAHRALALFTVEAARFGYAEGRTGNLLPGLAADFVVLDRDPFEEGFAGCTVEQTWCDGMPRSKG